MIYLQNTTISQDLQIPRSLPTPQDAALSLVLLSTMGEGSTTLEVTDNTPTSTYYSFNVTLSGQMAGEYEYKVQAGDTILAQGLLRIMESEVQVGIEEYETTIEYAQYGIN